METLGFGLHDTLIYEMLNGEGKGGQYLEKKKRKRKYFASLPYFAYLKYFAHFAYFGHFAYFAYSGYSGILWQTLAYSSIL